MSWHSLWSTANSIYYTQGWTGPERLGGQRQEGKVLGEGTEVSEWVARAVYRREGRAGFPGKLPSVPV